MTLEDQLTRAADADRTVPFDAEDLTQRAHRRRIRRRIATSALGLGVIVAAGGLALVIQRDSGDDTGPAGDPPSTTATEILTSDRWVPIDPPQTEGVLSVFEFSPDGRAEIGVPPCGSIASEWTLAGEAVEITFGEASGFGDCTDLPPETEEIVRETITGGNLRHEAGTPPKLLVDQAFAGPDLDDPGDDQVFTMTLLRVGDVGAPVDEIMEPEGYRASGLTLVDFRPDGVITIGPDADGQRIEGFDEECARGQWRLLAEAMTIDFDNWDPDSAGCGNDRWAVARAVEGPTRVRRMDDAALLIDGAEGTVRLPPVSTVAVDGSPLPDGTTGLPGVEELLAEALTSMSVEKCCDTTSGSEDVLATGFIWQGEEIAVRARVPSGESGRVGSVTAAINTGQATLDRTTEDGVTRDLLAMRCAPGVDLVLTNGVDGETGLRSTLVSAAEALALTLRCRPAPIPIFG